MTSIEHGSEQASSDSAQNEQLPYVLFKAFAVHEEMAPNEYPEGIRQLMCLGHLQNEPVYCGDYVLAAKESAGGDPNDLIDSAGELELAPVDLDELGLKTIEDVRRFVRYPRTSLDRHVRHWTHPLERAAGKLYNTTHLRGLAKRIVLTPKHDDKTKRLGRTVFEMSLHGYLLLIWGEGYNITKTAPFDHQLNIRDYEVSLLPHVVQVYPKLSEEQKNHVLTVFENSNSPVVASVYEIRKIYTKMGWPDCTIERARAEVERLTNSLEHPAQDAMSLGEIVRQALHAEGE